MTNNKTANRLQHELSPYLLQHQYNPVEWYPWGEEAFAKAKRENKPIFLSIGYSTCHWCHVMEHESFEDAEVAGILNQHFVAIKVDREERPDVDGVYMTVCQNMTGHGGWPLTIMMTHEKKPFFAGTYFPKEDKHNRPGMMSLLSRVAVLWKNQNQEILNSAEEIVGALQQYNQLSGEAEPTEELLHKAFKQFEERFDKEQGGFGNAPKFPSPHNLTFLLRYHEKYNNPASLQMVEDTLKAMRAGGIYDHIGYGFHRYSTDREWLLPHFEKMLYDQALLMIAYAEAFAISGEELYRSTISEISRYVERVLTSPEGGFYSAEDADSEGEEGKFYLWHQHEVEQLLGEKAAEYIAHYNFKKAGNFFDPFKGDYTGENIPHLKTREYQATQQCKKENQILFDEREKRVHPHKDDKVLTDWNGLMIAAFAKASTIVNEEHLSKRLLGNAIKAEQFIAGTMMREGRLLHRYRSGTAGINGTLEDYAFMIWGLLELFYATAESKYLTKAVSLQAKQDELFYNTEQGAYYTTAHDAEELMIRQIELYDGAIPSGNSVAINNLVALYNITGNEQLNQKLTQSLKVLTPITGNYPSGHTQYLNGVLQHLAQGTTNIVVATTKHEAEPLIQKYIGNQLLQRPVLLTEENREEIIKLAPWIKDYKQVNGKPTLYSCQNFTCEVPKN